MKARKVGEDKGGVCVASTVAKALFALGRCHFDGIFIMVCLGFRRNPLAYVELFSWKEN